MCKYCERHGLDDKWYYNVQNYARELESDPERRQYYAGGAMSERLSETQDIAKTIQLYTDPAKRPELDAKREKEHFGQVVPLEDAKKILQIADPIGVHACSCRRIWTGETENVCLKFGLLPIEVYEAQPFPERKIHPMSKEDATALIEKCDRKGYFHQVFTWYTPFVGSMCNCSWPACGEFRERTLMGITSAILKSHYVAVVDFDKCNGCEKCLTRCYTDAMKFNRDLKKAMAIPTKCFGCGLCRVVCDKEAISLIARESIPALKEVW